MKKDNKWWVLALLLLMPVASLSAQEGIGDAPQDRVWSPRVTGAPSLLITPDATSAGLGETGLLAAQGAFALMHNMSLLPLSEQTWGVSLSFTPWMPDLSRDTNLSTLLGYYSIDGASGLRHSVAAGVRYFSVGQTLAFPKSQRTVLETRPYELSVDLGYGLRILPSLSMGVGLRYFVSDYNISQSGVSSLAQTVMGDLSLTYRQPVSIESLSTELTAAVAIRNIGGKISHDGGLSYLYSPAALDFGVGVRLHLTESDELSLLISGDKLMVPQYPTTGQGGGSLDEQRKAYYKLSLWEAIGESWSDPDAWRDLGCSVGLQYAYKGRAFGRVGYRHQSPDAGPGAGLSLGGGFRYEMVQLDLAYFVAQDSKSPLNNTLRVTLSTDF